jgi:putative tryptophan/tyrosine transport system substrate-binding protein
LRTVDSRMERRTFIGVLSGSLLAAPLAAEAQQVGIRHRIGWISAEPQPDLFLEGFREGLRRHGYVEGQNILLDLRYAPGNIEALRSDVSSLIRSKVAFIVASGLAIRAIKTVEDVSVLFAISGDPVELGIAQSLARPGRNFTGITFQSLELAGKRIDLLKEAIPRLRALAVLSNVDHPGEGSERRATEMAAQALGITVAYIPFSPAELENALGTVRNARADAMVVFPEGVTMRHRAKIAQFAIAQRLPAMFGWSEYAEAGGLLSYGANQRETYMHLASYADKLLRGTKPTDLPIEQPTKFELVINLKTAKALALTIPAALLQRADQVIE